MAAVVPVEIVHSTEMLVILDVAKAIIALVGVIFTGMMAYFTAKLNVKADIAEKSRHKTARGLQNIAKVTREINAQVHASMATQLKLGMELAKKVASYTNSPEDIIAAAKAEKLYNDHMAKTEDLVAPLTTALEDIAQ